MKMYLLQLVQVCDPPDFGVCWFGLLAGVFPACFAGWGVATWPPAFLPSETDQTSNTKNTQKTESYRKESKLCIFTGKRITSFLWSHFCLFALHRCFCSRFCRSLLTRSSLQLGKEIFKKPCTYNTRLYSACKYYISCCIIPSVVSLHHSHQIHHQSHPRPENFQRKL